jgi:hypothetical protein
MSDPRYPNPMNDPVRRDRRDPLQPGTPRYDVQDDGSRTGMWAWIVGIIAVIVLAMVVYDYNRPISTAASPPVNPPSTTGSASPAQTPAPPMAPAPKAP